MQFYLFTQNTIHLEILLDILKSENIYYKVKTTKSDFFTFLCPMPTNYEICINCDYEKFEYIKYIYEKKKNLIEKLEKQYTPECCRESKLC